MNIENKKYGWIKLYRSIMNHWVWEVREPFCRRAAFVDLLMLVNKEDKEIEFDNKLILVKRGERITSLKYLSDRWGWSTTKLNNFLKLLESDQIITLKKDSRKTLIKICNYEDYQVYIPPEKNREKTEENNQKDTEKTVKNTNKNLKNLSDSEVVGVERPDQPSDQPDEIPLKFNEIFGSPLTPTYYQAIQGYLNKGLSEEMIVLAIEQTGFQGKKNFSYLKGILNNWYNLKLQSVEEARELIAKHEENNVIQFNQRKGGKASGKGKVSGNNSGNKKAANEYDKYF